MIIWTIPFFPSYLFISLICKYINCLIKYRGHQTFPENKSGLFEKIYSFNILNITRATPINIHYAIILVLSGKRSQSKEHSKLFIIILKLVQHFTHFREEKCWIIIQVLHTFWNNQCNSFIVDSQIETDERQTPTGRMNSLT